MQPQLYSQSRALFGLSGRCDAGRSHEFYEIEHGLRIRPVNDRAPLSIKYYDSRGRQSPEMVAERALLNTEPAAYFTRGESLFAGRGAKLNRGQTGIVGKRLTRRACRCFFHPKLSRALLVLSGTFLSP